MHDALIRASSDLFKSSSFDSRKIIIILSDGTDTASHSNAKDCMAAAVSSDATILVVDASVPSERNSPGQVYLRKVAESSGGFVLPAREESEVKGAFRKIDVVLRNQYALTYKPALFARNGAYRTIQLTPRKQGFLVHARKGYYAAPD